MTPGTRGIKDAEVRNGARFGLRRHYRLWFRIMETAQNRVSLMAKDLGLGNGLQ